MTATREQIVNKFLSLNYWDWTQRNWGCVAQYERDYWNVDDDTYINGVPMTIDFDFLMAYLLEVVERDTSVVSYVLIATFGTSEHESAWFEPTVGTFFDRQVETHEVMLWAVAMSEDLFEQMSPRS